MRKLNLLLMSFLCLCSLGAYATSHCDKTIPRGAHYSYVTPTQKTCQKPCTKVEPIKPCQPKCPQTYSNPCKSECFLCTNTNMMNLFKQMNLSETQICNAMKLQDKYEQEVYSLNERLECENANLCQLKQKCNKGRDYRETKKTIKELKKTRKEICKCYEDQFKSTLSADQKRAYRKYKKCK